MKQLLTIFFIFHLVCSSNAQTDLELEIQNLEKQLDEATSDTARVQLLCVISNKGSGLDSERSLRYSHEALELAQRTNNRYYIAKALLAVSHSFTDQGEYSKSLLTAEKALVTLGPDTINYQNNSERNNRLLGQIYNRIGMTYDYKSQYANSIKHYLKALDVSELLEDIEATATCYNNIGISYLYANNLDKSEEYFNESIKIYQILGDTATANTAKMNLGVIQYYREDFEGCIQLFKEVEVVMKKTGDLQKLGHCQTNIGETYKELGEYDSALVYIKKGIEIDFKLGALEGLCADYRILGDLYLNMGNLNLARENFNKSLDLAIKTGRKSDLRESHKQLYELEVKSGNYKEALYNYEKYAAYADTIKTESSSSKLGKIEAENEFNKEIAAREAENKKRLEIEEEKRARQTIILYFTIAILGVILLFAYLVLRSLRIARKQKKLVQEANFLLEEKNNELTDSIRYAKRIQLALLKEDNDQLSNLPEHFILFEPKDIVSGDFYWTYRMENYWYIAAADCTGHGVPGAMLTMLGTAYLNEICSGNELHTPSQLLDKLKNKIAKELSQTGSQGESKDGMDMSVLRLNMSTGDIEWAGANNPLYQVRNGELSETKADKQPIGYSDNVTPYTNHKIEIQKGDSLYLFSDGFADQFGGPKGKKYKYSNFKKILIETNSMRIEDQKNSLLESFRNWQGNLEQLDDVCVIGIRF